MFEKIKAVIFDMDGTLIDSMGVWSQIDHEFLMKRHIPVPSDIHRCIEGMSFPETAEYFKERFQLPESIEEIMAEWTAMCKAHYEFRVPLKQGALALIQHLHARGFKIGMGTSSRHELVDTIFKRHNLHQYFDTVRTSCEVGRGKPFPDIFLKVAEDLGVPPEECLVFEDTLAGVLAGKRAGMKVVAVQDDYSLSAVEEIRKTADAYIGNFEEIA